MDRVSFSLGQAPKGRVRPVGRGRGEPVGNCGTPANEPGLSTPLRCGQRSCPRVGAGYTLPFCRPPTARLRAVSTLTAQRSFFGFVGSGEAGLFIFAAVASLMI